MMKRRKIRLDDSFLVKTLDNKTVRMKPFLITAGFARSGATTSIRRALRAALTKSISQMSYDTLVRELISKNLQYDLKSKLKKYILW